jgi:hypothetical protein
VGSKSIGLSPRARQSEGGKSHVGKSPAGVQPGHFLVRKLKTVRQTDMDRPIRDSLLMLVCEEHLIITSKYKECVTAVLIFKNVT